MCGDITVVGERKAEGSCSNCKFSQSFTYGIETGTTVDYTTEYSTSVSTSFSLGFGFDFGLDIGGEFLKEVSKPASTSVGKSFTKSQGTSPSFEFGSGQMWQFVYSGTDQTGKCGPMITTNIKAKTSFALTNGLHKSPCCLLGYFKEPSGTSHSPCADGYPCLCETHFDFGCTEVTTS